MGTPARLTVVFSLCVLFASAGAVAFKARPRPLDLTIGKYPSARITDGKLVAPFPTQTLLARIGSFDDELSAYLWFDYLRGRPLVQGNELFLTASEKAGKASHDIYVALPNDALSAVPYLTRLESGGLIQSYDFVFCTPSRADYARKQTAIFVTAYKKPVHQKLEALTAEQLAPAVARFVLFKSRTDPRTRSGDDLGPSSLDSQQANALASDIIAVSNFYDIPLDVFLGIGAMENNYLNVPGDLEHSIWKRRAAKDDIILKRRKRRVLVSNYSVGVWQITRETLRYAHTLYLKDSRDYTELPERLRPPQELQFDLTNSHVLTTYAGLLLRDLLDRFDGDVAKAVGAYNGGPRNPNPQYAAGVNMVAQYARNILERVSAAKGRAVAGTALGQDAATQNVNAGSTPELDTSAREVETPLTAPEPEKTETESSDNASGATAQDKNAEETDTKPGTIEEHTPPEDSPTPLSVPPD